MDPTRPITKSNRGTASASTTAKIKMLDLTKQRWKQKSEKKTLNKYYVQLLYVANFVLIRNDSLMGLLRNEFVIDC